MISTGYSIQATLASFATDVPDNLFPRTIDTWDELVRVVNQNGGALKSKASDMHVKSLTYTAVGDDYDLLLETDVTGVPWEAMLVTPEGIMRLPVGLGLDRQARDGEGRTALMHAAQRYQSCEGIVEAWGGCASAG